MRLTAAIPCIITSMTYSTIDANNKLVILCHEVYLPKPKLVIQGPGGVEASYDFQGAKNTAANAMVTVTLVNDVASY